MKLRRTVDDLSVDELQRVLAEKKRLTREARLARYRETGRALGGTPIGQLPPGFAPEPGQVAPRKPVSLVRKIFDRLLLLVEIAAVFGLLYVLYSGTSILQRLNQEADSAAAASVAALPTIVPTPLYSAVVLPSGHTPPTSPGGAQPNEAEIPAHLRPLVQSMPAPAVPTQGPRQAQRIVIPAINVDAPIVQGDDWEQLKKGVGQHVGSGDAGQPGNHVLTAHNDIYGEIFRSLDMLQPGDEVQIQTVSEIFTYVIMETRVVEPTEVSVLGPTEGPTITLISCYPYAVDTQRIVVTGVLKGPGS